MSAPEPAPGPGVPQVVLVVEDEPQVMRFLRATLPTQGYRLVEAVTGQQGLSKPRPAPRT